MRRPNVETGTLRMCEPLVKIISMNMPSENKFNYVPATINGRKM